MLMNFSLMTGELSNGAAHESACRSVQASGAGVATIYNQFLIARDRGRTSPKNPEESAFSKIPEALPEAVATNTEAKSKELISLLSQWESLPEPICRAILMMIEAGGKASGTRAPTNSPWRGLPNT